MSISFDKAFNSGAVQPTTKPTTPVVKPKSTGGLTGGIPFDKAFANAPPAKPSFTDALWDQVKKDGSEGLQKLKSLGESMAKNPRLAAGPLYGFNPELKTRTIQYTNAAIKDLTKAFREPTNTDLLQGPKVALDALNALWSPIQAAVDVNVSEPIKAALGKASEIVSRYQEYSPAERRKAWESGQQLKDANELSGALNSMQQLVDPALNALQMLPIGEAGIAKSAAGLEREASKAGKAIEDLHGPLEPPAAPKIQPLTFSLDNTMGFKGIKEAGDVIPPDFNGKFMWSKAVVEKMLPHASGYAKSFLEKLHANLDENVKVQFARQAGRDPRTLGVYIPSKHEVTIATGRQDVIHTIVHELVHATTVNMLNDLIEKDLKEAAKKAGRDLTIGERTDIIRKPNNPVLKELDQVIREAKLRTQRAGRSFYGLRTGEDFLADKMASPEKRHWSDLGYASHTDRVEFIAEVFSNPQLQEFLANSEKYASPGYKFKNMLNQLGMMIGKHLGIKNPHELQLLNQSMRIGTQLMRMQYEGGAKKYRDFYDAVVGTLHDGEQITKRQVEDATRPEPEELGRRSGKDTVKEAKNALRLSVEQILRAVNPEGLGGKAKTAAAVVSSRLAEHMQSVARWRFGSATRAKYWRANDHLAEEFIDKFEKGENFSDPILQKFAQKYRDWNKAIFAQDRLNGFDYEPRDHYLPHLFTDSEGVANYFTRKYGAKWGDPGFIKDRTFDFYKEARAAGFTPKFSSPEDIMLARQQASDLAHMNIGILNELASYGLATRKIKGETKLVKNIDAEGKVSLSFQKIEGNKQPAETTRWRAPNGDVFWVDNQAAVVLENAFRSKSLWSDQSAGGMLFRSFMHAKNLIVPIRLSLSLFHPLHIVGIDIAAGMTRELSSILSGDTNVLKGFAGMLKSGLDPFGKNPKLGWKVLRAMRGQLTEAEMDPSTTEAVKTILDGGLILDMSPQYQTHARQAFTNALLDLHADWRRGSAGGMAWDVTRATWHLPWAILASIQAPIFEHWIPALKGASYLQDAQNLLRKNPELAENPAARKVALRKLAKSAENRYGEMAYNTLFWKRWIKDLAVMNTLSLGWQLGFLREYGGGAMDLGQFARGGAQGRMKMIKQGLLDRPLFVASYTTLGAGMAGLMTFAMTGKPPSSLMDYIDPQVGGENADGTPKRVSTMFYSREFVALWKHIQDQGMIEGISKLVANKSSGLFGLVHEWTTGVNDFGEQIRDPNADLLTQIEQTAAYTLGDLEPIALSSLKVHASTTGWKDKALAYSGFTPAPKYVTQTRTESMIEEAYDKYVAPKETPFDRAEYSQEFRQLKKYYDSGDARYGDALDSLVTKYDLQSKDIRRIVRTLNLDLPASVKMFIQLPWQEQKAILDKMSPDERDQFLIHANKEHLRNSYEPPQ